jgi:hypothetical protein
VLIVLILSKFPETRNNSSCKCAAVITTIILPMSLFYAKFLGRGIVIRHLAEATFAFRLGKGKGGRGNSIPFPFTPFPYFCKKSMV